MTKVGQAAHLARRAGRGEVGQLTLGFGGSAAYTLLPALLRDFRARNAGVEIVLKQLPLTEQRDALRAGAIDLGFVLMPFSDQSIATELVLRDRIVVAVPAGHRVAGRKSIGLKELADADFVAFPRTGGLGYHERLLDICRRAGFAPRIIREIAPMESIVGLVASGEGLAIVPAVEMHAKLAPN